MTEQNILDLGTARAVCRLLQDHDIEAVVEEGDFDETYLRIDPEDTDERGYRALVTDPSPTNPDGGWVLATTEYDLDMHTFEPTDEDPEPLNVATDADPGDVFDALADYLL